MSYKALAEAYGIPEDYAILLEATWHRQDPMQDELRECKHSHRLPEGIAEFVVIATARRNINDGVKLQEVVDRISKLEVFPTEQAVLEINESAKTHDFKHWKPKELRKHFQETGKIGFQILKHAAIYQKHIVEDEYGGIFPRRLPKVIEQEVNLLRQELSK